MNNIIECLWYESIAFSGFPWHFAAMNIGFPLKPPMMPFFSRLNFPLQRFRGVTESSSRGLFRKLRHVDVQALRWAWPFGTHHLWTLRRTPGRFLWRNMKDRDGYPWIRGSLVLSSWQGKLCTITDIVDQKRVAIDLAWLSSEIWWDLTLSHISKAFFWKLGIAVACINSHQNIS